jgi:hypothetical protein
MPHLCRASGCRRPTASRFSHYCSAHRSRARRHGDVEQKSVTTAELKPYLKRVRTRIKKNANNPVWTILESRWRALLDYARGVLAAHSAGRPGSRYERSAAREIVKLGDEVEVHRVVETALAMVMMLEFEPGKFASDRAFRTQLVRRVRALTDINFGESYQHSTGKVRRYYRELPPRATNIMAGWLIDLMGAAGLHVARLEKSEMERVANEKRVFHQALSELS